MLTYQEFARAIGINQQQLDNLVNFSDYHYNSFYISKKSKDKKRYINSPSPKIKVIQKWILENILYGININNRANGFIKGRGITRNALFHQNKQYLLCMDIYNFFPSITKEQIYKALKNELHEDELSFKIAKICTYKNRLPQGAPSSPYLSNIIFNSIDEEIKIYCNRKLVSYSRYADDLSFSSNSKESLIDIKDKISSILMNYNFKINSKKTRLYTGSRKMNITGLALNAGHPTLGKQRKRYIKSKIFYKIIKNDKDIKQNEIDGYLAFVKDVDPKYYNKLKEYIEKLSLKKGIIEI